MKIIKIIYSKILSFIFVIILFSINYVIGIENTNSFDEGLVGRINSLNSKTTFIFYDLLLSNRELEALKSIKISETDEYNNYGKIKELESDLKKFINKLDKDNKGISKEIAQIIGRLVNDVLQASGQETAWVALRAFTPTSEYNIPRWHTDGYYYAPYLGDPYKFAITLKGPSTLFYKLNAPNRKKFYDLQNSGSEQNEFNRQALSAMLGTSPKLISVAQPHQGAVYIVGSDNAAVHSEPPIKEERLFLSILPGTKEQIKEWQLKQYFP